MGGSSSSLKEWQTIENESFSITIKNNTIVGLKADSVQLWMKFGVFEQNQRIELFAKLGPALKKIIQKSIEQAFPHSNIVKQYESEWFDFKFVLDIQLDELNGDAFSGTISGNIWVAHKLENAILFPSTKAFHLLISQKGDIYKHNDFPSLKKDLPVKNITEIFNSEDSEKLISVLGNLKSQQAFSLRLKGKGGFDFFDVEVSPFITDNYFPVFNVMGFNVSSSTFHDESKNLLNEAQVLTKMGNWNYDIKADRLTWSEGLYHVFDVDRDTFKETHGSFISLIHEDDKSAAYNTSKFTQETGLPFHIQYRITTPKGENRIIEEFGYAEKDNSDKVVRLFGTAQNVTDRIELENKWKKAERFVEHTQDMLAIVGFDKTIKMVNPSWAKLTGWSNNELLKQPFLSFFSASHQNKIEKLLANCIAEKKTRTIEAQFICKDDSLRYFSIKAFPYLIENEIYVTARDISAEKLVFEELQKSEKRFKQIAEINQSIIWELDPNGLITYISPNVELVWGYKPEELINKKYYYDLCPPNQKDIAKDRGLSRFERREVFISFENQVIHKNGDTLIMLSNGEPFFDSQGKYAGYRGADIDVSQLVAVRDQRDKTNEMLAKLAAQIPGVVYQFKLTADGTMSFPYASQGIREVYGVEPNEVEHSAQVVIDRLHPDDRDRVVEEIRKSAEDLGIFQSEYRVVLPGCQPEWRFATAKPERQPDGSTLWHGFIMDHTTKKKTDAAFKLSQERYRSIINVSNTGAWEFQIDPPALWVSPEYLRMLGYETEAPQDPTESGMTLWLDLLHPEDREEAQEKFLEYLKNPSQKDYENQFRLRHADGSYRWIWSKGKGLMEPTQQKITAVLGAHIDITGIKNAEKRIKESEVYYKSLLKAIPDMMFVIGETMVFEDFKANAEDLMFEPEFFIGKEISRVLPPHVAEPLIAAIKLAVENNHVEEFDYQLKINNKIEFFNARLVAFGQSRVIVMVRKITESVQNLNRIKKLLHQQKTQNDRLTNFTHIVSHNLRSHTANMQGLLTLVAEDSPEIFTNPYIAMLKSSADNLNETLLHLNEVLDISRDLESKYLKMDVVAALERTANSIQQLSASEGVEIIIETKNLIPTIKTIPAYIESIFLNLLTNAIKFKNPKAEKPYVKVSLENKKNKLKITFQDNGLGIDLKRHKDKIFGMYKTFHNHPESKGLGLFITKKHLEALNGQIEVISEVGIGTSFLLELPIN